MELPEADGYDHITYVLTTRNRHKTSAPATHNCKDSHSKLIDVTIKLYARMLLLLFSGFTWPKIENLIRAELKFFVDLN